MEIPLWFTSSTGTELTALFVIPEGWLNVPVVILIRGDAAPEADGQDERIARALATRGIAALLLDFSSTGPPPAELTQHTLEQPIEDLGSAIDELRLQRGVNVGEVGVGGTDIAGTVALLRATFDPRIRALVLRSTPAPTTQLPTDRVTVPTLIIDADDDEPVLAGTRSLEQWLAGPYEILFVPHAGHSFTAPGAFETACNHTADWFVKYLGTGVRTQAA